MISLNEMTYYELQDERNSALEAIKQIRSLESTSQKEQDKLLRPLCKIVAACEKELDNRF